MQFLERRALYSSGKKSQKEQFPCSLNGCIHPMKKCCLSIFISVIFSLYRILIFFIILHFLRNFFPFLSLFSIFSQYIKQPYVSIFLSEILGFFLRSIPKIYFGFPELFDKKSKRGPVKTDKSSKKRNILF